MTTFRLCDALLNGYQTVDSAAVTLDRGAIFLPEVPSPRDMANRLTEAL